MEIVTQNETDTSLKSANRLSNIDLLRGTAILLVIICHVSQSQVGLPYMARSIFNFGQIGVQLFFFLSAYTLCLSMEKRVEKRKLLNFYIRRFFRIAPLYYLGIIVYYCVSNIPVLNISVVVTNNKCYTLLNVLSNLTFVHGAIQAYNNCPLVPGGWTISDEMLFYLIFPLLFIFFKKNGNKRWFSFLIPILGLFFSCVFFAVIRLIDKNAVNNYFFYYDIINQLPVFLLGISYFNLSKRTFKRFSPTSSIIFFFLFFIIAFSLSLKLKNDFSTAIFFSGISFMFLTNFASKLKMRFRVLEKIGRLSFSIYIFHFLFAFPLTIYFVKVVGKNFNSYISLFFSVSITLICSFVIAFFSEKLIEKPGINIGKRIIRYISSPI